MPSPRFSFGTLLKKWLGAEAKFEKSRQLRRSTKLSLEAMEDRITPAVQLDATFGVGGKVFTDFEANPAYARANAVAVQSDGKILVAGEGGYLIRMNADGSNDLSFGDAGRTRLNGVASGIALDSLGRVVVAGYVDTVSGRDFALARYDADGAFDGTFGNVGFVSTDFGSSEFATSLAIDPWGRIVVAGTRSESAQSSHNDFAVARYNLDGSLDTSFSGDGKVVTAFGLLDDRAQSVAVDASGRVIVAGITCITDYTRDGNEIDFAVARYEIDGSLDTSFDGDGKVATSFGFMEQVQAVVVDRQGRIVVGGYSTGAFALARYDTNGSLDSSFDGDGKVTFGNASYLNALAIDSSDRIVAAGYRYGLNQDFGVARLLSNGSLDSTFDGDGVAVTPVGSGGEEARAVAIDSSGRIVAAGWGSADTTSVVAIVRYAADGSLDATFDGDGKRVIPYFESQDFASGMALDASGRIIVGGHVTGDFALARYNPDGKQDTTFDGDGRLRTDFGFNERANAMAIDGSGRIILAGYANTSSGQEVLIARYSSAGALDQTFDGDGWRLIPLASTADQINSIALDASGRIVLVGSSGSQMLIIRCNADGSLDSTFDSDGILITSFGPSRSYANSVVLDGTGRIVVAGGVGAGIGVARFDSNGSLDSTFDGDGRATVNFGTSFEGLNGVAIDNYGRIVAVGFSDASAGQLDFAIARFQANGSLDAAFDGDGKLLVSIGTGTDLAGQVIIDALDRIIVAGHAVNSGDRDFGLVRLMNDGAMDTSLDGDGKFTTSIGTGEDVLVGMKFDASGRIVLGGYAVALREDFAVARLIIGSEPPVISLQSDTGRPADKVTSDGRLTLSGVLQGATVEYSIDSGVNWTSTFTPVEGLNSVRVRQTDSNSNTSVASNPFVFALDTSDPQVASLSSVAPNPRNVSLTSLEVLFSESIDLATFNYADLVLQRDGGSNLIGAGSGVSIAATANPNLYRIQLPSALTAASGNYVLKVNAAGITDLADNAATNDVQSSWAMHANGVLGVPVFASPLGAVNDATPTISWSAVTYAGKYDLWIDNLTTGASQVVRQQNLAGTSFTPSANLAFGSYRMWIRAFNGAGTPGSWSAGVDFRIAAPTLTGLVGTASFGMPTITWSAIDGAARYDLWVDNVSTGVAQVMRRTNLTATQATPSSPLAAGLYRVWVRALDAAGNSTAWSAASDFTVGIPTITGPVGTASSSTPTIVWTGLPNVSLYDLWVDNLTTGASPVIRHQTLATHSYDVTTPLSAGQYRVWVRAFDFSGAASPWSKSHDFVVGIPTVTAPIGIVQTTTPAFTWMAVPNAARYDLWVDNITTGQSQVIRQTNVTTASFTPSSPLTASSTYCVWVRAFDAQNRASAWSAFADFSIGAVI
jgi:uncharacterized delta-60 repeat protein